MSDTPPNARIVAFAPRPSEIEKRIRLLALDTKNLKWSSHARERMKERDVSIRVALSVLREGIVMEQIIAGDNVGEWKAKIVQNVKGRRDVGVVAILVNNESIFVKTVEWEDIQ